MKKFFKKLFEPSNAEKLAKMPANAIYFDMCHAFSEQKLKKAKPSISAFGDTIRNQPFIEFAFAAHNYPDTNPQNQVLTHGIMYNALYNVYITHLKKCFDVQKKSPTEILCFPDYHQIPKRYRGVFFPFDKESWFYALNDSAKDLVIGYNKKNRKELERLLSNAKNLIPLIYKEICNEPDTNACDVLQFYQNPQNETKNFSGPAFVPDDDKKQEITDMQLKTIQQLHDIFVQIAKISFPVKPIDKGHHGAQKIYETYQDETNRKNIFWLAYENQKNVIKHKNAAISEMKNAFKTGVQSVNRDYADFRSKLLQILAQQTKVK